MSQLQLRSAIVQVLFYCWWAIIITSCSGAQAQQQQAAANVQNDGDTYEDTIDFSNFGRFLKETVFGQGSDGGGDGTDGASDPFSDLLKGVSSTGKDMLQEITKLFQLPPESETEPMEKLKSAADNDLLSNIISSLASSQQQESEPFEQLVEIFWNATKRMHEQVKNTFKDTLDTFKLNPLQAYYYMQQQEVEKNTVYKRKQHAFLPKLSEQQALCLTDGLFLSHLAYVDTCEHVTEHLQSFHNNSWALLNCSVTGKPSQPAHFVAVRKVSEPLQPPRNNLWERILSSNNKKDDNSHVLEVAIVVRGSKEIADFISDGLLEPVDYRGGKAHNGILESAQWLHRSYRDFFQHLLRMTGRRKLNLWLVGHSLGAGTASLAALEFNEGDNAANKDSTDGTTIEAHALGFGTPAIVSNELSTSLQSTVTTVINDADCIPRVSGAAMVNAWVEAASYQDWVDHAQYDIHLLKNAAKENLPFPELTETLFGGILDWLSTLKENQQQSTSSTGDQGSRKQFHMDPVLFPPGACIHLYRDGTKWQGVHMPCTRFDEIEAVAHLVWDHLIPTGYYVGLLGYLRVLKRDMNWRFDPDLMDLPVPV